MNGRRLLIGALLAIICDVHHQPDFVFGPTAQTSTLSVEAKGVAGLGKAGGDGQGGSDKAGQQVPPEVYKALTYAGSLFLLTLSVPLILYGLNKLLNKIEECCGCGPSNAKANMLAKQNGTQMHHHRQPQQLNQESQQTIMTQTRNDSDKQKAVRDEQQLKKQQVHQNQKLHLQLMHQQPKCYNFTPLNEFETDHPATVGYQHLEPVLQGSPLMQASSCSINMPADKERIAPGSISQPSEFTIRKPSPNHGEVTTTNKSLPFSQQPFIISSPHL